MPHSQAVEDYLRIIYELAAQEQPVTTNQLAQALEVRPASVTGMIQKLAALDPPLVDYRKHQGVVLTGEGERLALQVLRHHRLLELFLQKVLGYSWDQVHAEADKLEHAVSQQLEQRIDALLGLPERDPHGDPIPNAELRMPKSTAVLLRDLRPGQRAVLLRVHDEEPELLRYLADQGLLPGARLGVEDYSPFDGNLHLQVEGHPSRVVLGPAITNRISVEPFENEKSR